MVHNAEDTWKHVAKNILLLPQKNIDLLHKKRICYINFFCKSMDFDRLENAVGAKDGMYYELEDFFKYMVINTPSNNELMLLTHDEYCAISYSTIQAALEEITMKSSPSPTKGISTNATQPNTRATQGSAVQTHQNATSQQLQSHCSKSDLYSGFYSIHQLFIKKYRGYSKVLFRCTNSTNAI